MVFQFYYKLLANSIFSFYSNYMENTVYTFNCSPEILEKIKIGSENSGLSESQFIATCIEYFFYKNSSCQNKKEGLPLK